MLFVSRGPNSIKGLPDFHFEIIPDGPTIRRRCQPRRCLALRLHLKELPSPILQFPLQTQRHFVFERAACDLYCRRWCYVLHS